MVFRDETRERRADGFLVDGVGHVEIEPALRGADVASRDAVLEYRAEQVHRRVHAHVAVAPVPVDRELDARTGWWRRSAFLEHMADIAIDVARIDYRGGTAVPAHRAGIAGLSAAERVEHGPVAVHGRVVNGRHCRAAGREVGILAKQFFCACAHKRASSQSPISPITASFSGSLKIS